MKRTSRSVFSVGIFAFVVMTAPQQSWAGAHTWDVWEVFTNADGTIQFVELKDTSGTNETGLGGHVMQASPSGHTYTLVGGIVGPTTGKSYLLGTTAYAALPGAPAPDEILPDNFLALTDTSCSYTPLDTASWAPGALPTDGIHSLSRLVTNGPMTNVTNSPKNYAGATATIDASGGAGNGLPGVPEGSLRVDKLVADGSQLSLTWDVALCSGELDHQILYGQKSDFPAIPGGNYALQGGQCNIGTGSPYTWTPTPSASDGSGLIWFLMVVENNANREGPWGKYNATAERNGPGTNGASNVCGVTDRDVSNVCGH